MLMGALVVASVPIYMLDRANRYAALLAASAHLPGPLQLFRDPRRRGNLMAVSFLFCGCFAAAAGIQVWLSDTGGAPLPRGT